MTGGLWIASYVTLWVAVVVLALAVVVLLRHIGTLHARIQPVGVHGAGEGLEPGDLAPAVDGADFAGTPLTLVAFTAPACPLCEALLPSLHALDRAYRDVALAVVEHGSATAALFDAYRVASTPYIVAVGGDGHVRGGGVANTLEQVEVLVEGALASPEGRVDGAA